MPNEETFSREDLSNQIYSAIGAVPGEQDWIDSFVSVMIEFPSSANMFVSIQNRYQQEEAVKTLAVARSMTYEGHRSGLVSVIKAIHSFRRLYPLASALCEAAAPDPISIDGELKFVVDADARQKLLELAEAKYPLELLRYCIDNPMNSGYLDEDMIRALPRIMGISDEEYQELIIFVSEGINIPTEG